MWVCAVSIGREKRKSYSNCKTPNYTAAGKIRNKIFVGKYKLNEALYSVPFSDYKAIVNQGGWKDVTWTLKNYTKASSLY
jgi:hypothetical protein